MRPVLGGFRVGIQLFLPIEIRGTKILGILLPRSLLPADMHHAARWLHEARFADVVAGFLLFDY